MKKVLVGPKNHRLLSHTTVRLVGQVAERRFRTDRLVITTKPHDAKLLVIDVRAGAQVLIENPPIDSARFAKSAHRRDAAHLRAIDLIRGTEVGVVISVTDVRDVHVTVWVEQLEREDLS